MAFRDHLKRVKIDSRKLIDFNGLPAISNELLELPIILDGFESNLDCKLALDVCQTSVIADTLGIEEKEIGDLIESGIAEPKDPKLISRDDATALENCIDEVDLSNLPIPQYFPIDAGKYLTSAMVFVMDEGVSNASFHRMLILEKDKMAIRIVPRHLHQIIHKNMKIFFKIYIYASAFFFHNICCLFKNRFVLDLSKLKAEMFFNHTSQSFFYILAWGCRYLDDSNV